VPHRSAPHGHRVLIVAPFGRDAESVSGLLTRDGYNVTVLDNVTELAAALDEATGAIILTEEALVIGASVLREALTRQPAWSDIPVVLFAARRSGTVSASEAAIRRSGGIGANLIVLERPLSSVSLLSAIASALRSRQRQFEMRDRLQELRESEAKFQAITNSIDHMVWSARPDGFHDYYNQRWYDYTGMPEGSTYGAGWNDMFHPDDQERAWAAWEHSLATGDPYHIEYRLKHRSGEYRWVLGRAQPVQNEAGDIVRWYGTCTEIQEIVEARDVLSRNREDLERMVEERTAALQSANEHLRQSQKMEAVGQLTGGIAHDFNNMLTGIIGAMDIMKRRIAAGRFEDLSRFMDAATQSATRAAGLTQRLLAFSRRQSLDSKPIDINHLVLSLDDLLRRTITEQIDLQIAVGEDVPPGIADANQLESAILNLAINARDAMPDGGKLTVETKLVELDEAYVATRPDIKPGHYVMVAVSDTGVGMAPDLIDKVVEPFFTTKPIGQGTGLGLSMVYGFARQSGGQVRIHSRPGEGTSVKIYLPAAQVEPEVAAPTAAAVPVGGGQTVLVVEDDASVRLLVREVLEEMGYITLEAADAPAAIPILSSDTHLDLMVSDVGLPGMNGRQLAEVARQHRAELPILFITGYAENAAIRAGFLGTNMSMITKPFSLEELAHKIDEMLAGQAAEQQA
jgi:PAS domain S-box-containing protein